MDPVRLVITQTDFTASPEFTVAPQKWLPGVGWVPGGTPATEVGEATFKEDVRSELDTWFPGNDPGP